jgi:diguanylate cyclase (GGDEF)-like protein
MSLLSLPDIVGMLVLMGVLAWFRNRHKDERVDVWLLGLTFILIEMIAAAVIHASGLLTPLTHVITLDAYLLAAVVFGWAARRDLLPGTSHLPHFLLPAVPLFLLTTLFGLDMLSAGTSVLVASFSVVFGITYLLFFARLRRRSRSLLVIIHLTMWLPMLYLAASGRGREVVYWGLACLYLLVALSFRRSARPDCIGAWVIMVAFVIWAMCFLAYPLNLGHPYADSIIEQVWNIQKFFVVIGMLIVLLEDETLRRKHEALQDPLTGLPNRRLFDDRLALALERSRRTGLSAAVFAIDLNGFKNVNDTLGHQAGDLVLRRVADRLKRKVRGSDTLARCGGDEFSVIVNDLADPESCTRIAEALRYAIQGVRAPGSTSLPLDGSIGFAVYPEEARDGQTLCKLADARMYQQKQSRGNFAAGHISVAPEPLHNS